MENTKTEEVEIDLLQLLHMLWHKAYIILLAAVLVGGLFFYHSAYQIDPLYQSDAYIYVNNSSVSFVGGKISISPGELDAAQSLVDVYAFIAKSRTALNEVINRAGLDYTYEQLRSMISASAVDGMEILRISVRSTNPVEAEYINNTIADVLPEAIAKVVDGSSVRIIDYAIVPQHKISPNITKNTMMGMLLGGIVSCAVIVVLALMNDTIRDKDALLQNYDFPLLASIPKFSSKSGSLYGSKNLSDTGPTPMAREEPLTFEATEAYNLLRSNLLLSVSGSEHSVIGITSPLRGEGKSTTSINLAHALAKVGKKVCLMELDMRLPTVAQYLSLKRSPGFTDYVLHLNSAEEATQTCEALGGMKVITAGSIPPNPSEILSMDRMEEIFTSLKQKYDYTIVDLPPINLVSDTLMVSKHLTGLLLVVRQDFDRRRELNESLRQLKIARANIIGFVLNNASTAEKEYRRKYGSKYGYQYGYRQDPQEHHTTTRKPR